ncbi:DUF2441 domain-containing protein [Pandoraea pnomenusa]|uniref:DUF2441 domain-containing protein n=1 Tax=Pandoraea pnomenusa TaxID=93220 RepID=UPI00333ED644
MPDDGTALPCELLYVSPMLLGPGTIIPPGNFGKNILSHTPSQGANGWAVVRELIFEQVRSRVAPHLPSRLNCCFLFTSVAAALEGGRELSEHVHSPVIYCAEIVDASQPQCLGDYDTIKMIDANQYVDSSHRIAIGYWSAAVTGKLREGCLPELLTASPIRIVREYNPRVPNLLIFPTTA